MRRREFIMLLGATAAVWPIAARAQQPATPAVGVLLHSSVDSLKDVLAAFRHGLSEAGSVEGRDVILEYRSADGQLGRLPKIAAELIGRPVKVVFAGSASAALAAKAASSTVPIVFAVGNDLVKLGLLSNFNRPEGNATGVVFFSTQLETKRLGLLHELVPGAADVAVLINADQPSADDQAAEVIKAGGVLGIKAHILKTSSESDIDAAFGKMSQMRIGALLVTADNVLYSRRDRLVALAAKYAIPAIYESRYFTAIGGLASYGTSVNDAFYQAGVYVSRLLKGATIADLPAIQTTKFEFVINLKTARALNIDVPPTLSARADDIIE
jgi:putative ABC transport system substrate-binding protein